ncbi:MAG: TolC family protein, partial [Anaerolineae bacterium]|nr:TolC family protein [Anaerolineae bacterium]
MRKRIFWTICLAFVLFTIPASSQGEEDAAGQPELVEATPADETPATGEAPGVDKSPETDIQTIPETIDETAEDKSTTPIVPVPVPQSDLVLPSRLDLLTAQQVAVRDNPSIKAAEMRVAQAQQRVRQAMAAYFPSIDFSAGITKTWLAENDFRAARNAPLQG